MSELWELLCSAQENIGGIPAKFVEQKKEEIKKRQVIISAWVKVFRSIPEFRILRLTFHRKSASKC